MPNSQFDTLMHCLATLLASCVHTHHTQMYFQIFIQFVCGKRLKDEKIEVWK